MNNEYHTIVKRPYAPKGANRNKSSTIVKENVFGILCFSLVVNNHVLIALFSVK